MKKPAILLSLLIILHLVISGNSRYPFARGTKENKVQAAVDSVRRALCDSLGIAFPSMSVLIQTPTDKIFVCSAEASAQKVTANTYYRFASNTKNFTSAAILHMYENGWLDYKANINALIPGSNVSYIPSDWDFPYKKDITIELLLQHAAGVYDVDNDSVPGCNGKSFTEFTQVNDPTHQFSTAEMVKVLKDKNLFYYAPGGGHHYSNTGFSILAEIIKRVYSYKSGKQKTYADYMNDSLIGKTAKVPLKTIHFPVLATDTDMPGPYLTSTVLNPATTEHFGKYNMSAQVGEGNGYGTMEDLNTYIRTMMKGQNILKPATVKLMQTDLSPKDKRYALGCTFTPNLGYGHNGARIGYLSVMAYDAANDVSVVSMIPLWDLRKGSESFIKCFTSIYDAAYAARQALGLPGKPLGLL